MLLSSTESASLRYSRAKFCILAGRSQLGLKVVYLLAQSFSRKPLCIPRKVSATVIQTFILLSYKIIYCLVVHSRVGFLFCFVVVQSLCAVRYYSGVSLICK